MKPLDARTTAAMARVKSTGTLPEERVASALRALGVGYRRNVRNLPGTPDFANRSRGWVIQVHGCFWHQHDCGRGTMPKHNADLWQAKFARNRRRDAEADRHLQKLGLDVFTVWECETRNVAELAERIASWFEDRPRAVAERMEELSVDK